MENNGKKVIKNNMPIDTSKELHFKKDKNGNYLYKYSIVKFTPKDMVEIQALIDDLETNVGLRDVSTADLMMMLVNRYRLYRKSLKDKSRL